MAGIHQQLVSILQRFLSPVTSEMLMRRALHDANLTAEQLTLEHMSTLSPHLERGIRLFVSGERQEPLRHELRQVASGTGRMAPPPRAVRIRIEADISEARLAARDVCTSLGARSLSVHKVATIVSELARNIVSYTPGGVVELAVLEMLPPRLQIRAVDTGAGIHDLKTIMGGTYKSKTGMGKGLLGVKRLSDSFEIDTSTAGTRVEVAVSL
jgi:serine/threonine-protein kinase RsbT